MSLQGLPVKYVALLETGIELVARLTFIFLHVLVDISNSWFLKPILSARMRMAWPYSSR